MLRVRRQLLYLVRDALFAAILVVSKEMLAFLPNVEMVTMLLMAYTAVYRVRALVPLYIFVAIQAILYPSVSTTLMYLYIWLIPWGIMMLIPRRFCRLPVFVVVGALFGLTFGVLCSPVQVWYFGIGWQGGIAWILAGLPWDVVHAVGNAAMAFLAPAVCRVLTMLQKPYTEKPQA